MTKATSLTTYLTEKYNFLSYDSTLELVTEQLGNATEGFKHVLIWGYTSLI